MHNYAAPKFIKVLRSPCRFLLGLTATLKRKDGEHIRLIRAAPLVYSLPLDTARKLGFVSDYEIYNLGVDFQDLEDKKLYAKHHGTFTNLFRLFDYNFEVFMGCVKGFPNYISNVAENNELTESEVKQKAFMCMNAMRKRKEVLYEAQSKIPIVKELIKRAGDVQTLIFTQTIDSCEKIHKELPYSSAYHSQIKGREYRGKKLSSIQWKKQIIEDFETHKTKRLIGAKALNEGFSVNSVEMAIFFSYTSDIRTFVQRMGRAVRFVIGKKAKIICLYMKPFQMEKQTIHSQELKWLKEAQKANIGTIKWVETIDEIFDGVPSVTF